MNLLEESVSPNLLKYLQILHRSSKKFKKAADFAISDRTKLEALMKDFFIPLTRENKMLISDYILTGGQILSKYSLHFDGISSNKSPTTRQITTNCPNITITIYQYLSDQEWRELRKHIHRTDKYHQQLGVSSILNKLKKNPARLPRAVKNIDLYLEIYRLYKEHHYLRTVRDKLSEMKQSGTFPIKTNVSFGIEDIRRGFKKIQKLLNSF